MPGRLLIVSTPIGNLEDLSPRARTALAEADLLACEDTRRTGLLLARLDLARPRLISLHEHNERARIPEVLARLEAGATVAIASDAGTPLLSDPGYPLVRAALAHGATIEAIPGPSALLAALVVSGLPPLPFTFLGFPPPKSGKRRTFWAKAAGLGHTTVSYESPHRIAASLADAASVLGERPAALARELTKLHEEVLRGTVAELRDVVAARGTLKGELVLVIGGADALAAAADKPSPSGETADQQPPSRYRAPRTKRPSRDS